MGRKRRSNKRALAATEPWRPFGVDQRVIVLVSGFLLFAAYYLLYGRLLPMGNGLMGHDWEQFLPNLLNGYYWQKTNGWFPVPWLTPANCGGVFFAANPQSMYFSVPQLILNAFGPAVTPTLVLLTFAVVGGVGMYALCRRLFGLDRWAALLAATLFMFNGFFAYRLIIGHLTYHSLALLPWIALLLGMSGRWAAARLLGVGVMFGYILLTGGAVYLPVAGLMLAGIGVMAALAGHGRWGYWFGMPAALVIGLLIAAGPLYAQISVLGNVPRDFLSLPGFGSFWDLLRVPLQALFVMRPDEYANSIMIPSAVHKLEHEWEFSVSIAPLLVFALWGWVALHARGRKAPTGAGIGQAGRWLLRLALFAILMLPVMLNFAQDEWHQFLKQVPVLKNTSAYFRWYMLYIPLVCIATGLALNKLAWSEQRTALVAGCVIVVALTHHALWPRDFYHKQEYSPATLQESFERIEAGDGVPEIRRLDAYQLSNGRFVRKFAWADKMTEGVSPFVCYEPLFGYFGRRMYGPPLKQGSIYQSQGGRFNMKNPACYVWPEANECKPGDHFILDQREQLKEFAAYRPYDYKISGAQRVANWISISSVIAVAIFLFIPMALRILRIVRSKPGTA